MSLVAVWIDSTRKGHCFGMQKREPSHDEVSARRCKTCLELASLVFGRSRFPFSKPGGFNVAWFEISEKKVKRCWAAAAMCNDKRRIELYPATSSIKKREPHHYLQPPTQCQFCLESTNARSSCDEQPAVMRILVSTQHLHPLDTNSLVQPSRLEKKGRGSIVIFPRSVRVKRFLSPKATILEPQVLTDGQL